MTKSRHTTISIPPDLTQKARAKAITEGSNLSAVIVAFLRAWLDGKIELPQPEEVKRKKKT